MLGMMMELVVESTMQSMQLAKNKKYENEPIYSLCDNIFTFRPNPNWARRLTATIAFPVGSGRLKTA